MCTTYSVLFPLVFLLILEHFIIWSCCLRFFTSYFCHFMPATLWLRSVISIAGTCLVIGENPQLIIEDSSHISVQKLAGLVNCYVCNLNLDLKKSHYEKLWNPIIIKCSLIVILQYAVRAQKKNVVKVVQHVT